MFSLTVDSLITSLLLVLIAIPIHEFAHCWSAYLMGDDTGLRMGRLTLNPLVHLDPWGTLLIFTSRFGWGRPAPVNPYRMTKIRNPRVAMALSALAGPLSNLALAVLLAIPFRLGWLDFWAGPRTLSFLARQLFSMNIGLMAFNLLPFPPLDGSHILAGVAPPPVAEFLDSLESVSIYLLMGVLFVLPMMGIDLVGMMVRPVQFWVTQLLLFL